MSTVLSVMVENNSGVLSRITGMFARRDFNIASLSVSETEDPEISSMTIVAEGDERQVEQVSKQLRKLIDVITVRELQIETSIQRELLLIRIRAGPAARAEIINIATIMECKIVALSQATLTLELCDKPEKVKELMALLTPYGIEEIVRTGTVALPKDCTSA